MRRLFATATLLSILFAHPMQATDSAVANAHMKRGDFSAAYREYRGLAEAGYPVYQNQVAAMHAEGKGVVADKVLAHVWYTLSASQGDKDAIRAKAILEQELNSAQLARAKTLARRYAADYVAPYRPPSWSLE